MKLIITTRLISRWVRAFPFKDEDEMTDYVVNIFSCLNVETKLWTIRIECENYERLYRAVGGG